VSLGIGIIGLPNVGKSTLFNALLKKQQALAANYPFATIEPNIGVVPVPDERLVRLAEITKEEEGMANLPPIKPATVEFVDIAGLVKGASEGAGLGNKFLSHIREVQIVAHVVRAFEDDDVIREGSVDVLSDYKTIETELILSDLQTLENSKSKNQKAKVQGKNKNELLERVEKELNNGIPARNLKLSDEEREIVNNLFLLSNKKEIIVLNVSENEYNDENTPKIIEKYAEILDLEKNNFVVICAKVESELSELSGEEQKEYLESLGVKSSGLEMLIRKAYDRLGLISFLTCGEKEVRAWTVRRGAPAPEAAGVIHTDFIKNFIKAETVSYEEFITNGGWKCCREKGKVRFEGRDYIMQEGDVVEFKIGR